MDESTFTEAERNKLRDYCLEVGIVNAAKHCAVGREAIARVIAGLPSHRSTLITIRSRMESI